MRPVAPEFHSPAPLTAGLREALAQLGQLRFIVPASDMHGHLFIIGHGEQIESGGHRALRDAYAWLR